MTKLESLKREHKIEFRLLHLKHSLDIEDLIRSGEQDCMVDPKVAALVTEFDAATDAIAARIQTLIDNGGLNAESQAALQSEVDKLTALGKTPEPAA